jgi:hypothetical protein
MLNRKTQVTESDHSAPLVAQRLSFLAERE